MSEVVPLPSFGEVFFDARGQERCLRVTWHEGTLVLSLWRGEMCTGSFRMPMDDVGRLLDTLDDGYAEATGEPPVEVAEEYPGTGQYSRPRPIDPGFEPAFEPQSDDRPTAALSPTDVLVARGAPVQPDKLVAATPPRAAAYGEPSGGYAAPATGEMPSSYGRRRMESVQASNTGPIYQMPGETSPHQAVPQSTDPLGFPMQAAEPYAPAHPDPFAAQNRPAADPFAAPFVSPPPPQQAPADPFAPPKRVPSTVGLGTPMHGIPGAGRRPADTYQAPAPSPPQTGGYPAADGYSSPPPATDGYPAQPADGYPRPSRERPAEAYPAADPYTSQTPYTAPVNPADPLGLGGRPTYSAQPDPQPYPGQPDQQSYRAGQGHSGRQDQQPYGAQQGYQDPQGHQDPQGGYPDPQGYSGQRDAQGYPVRPGYPGPDGDPELTRPYVQDQMFVTGERLRPEQQEDRGERRDW